MASRPIPFYAQTALLDKYIHAEDPLLDPEAIDVIVNLLKSREDIRYYFFRSNPSAAWAKILWIKGFFSQPPEPEITSNGLTLKPWDIQYFLISVASQVPEIVIKHISTISGHGWYLARAIEALCKIPVDESEKVLGRLLDWLADPETAVIIEKQILDFIDLLIKQNKTESALMLFDAVIAPRKYTGPSRVSFSEHKLFGSKDDPVMVYERLKSNSPKDVVLILEKHLIASLKNEAEKNGNPNAEFSASWRSAIDDTDQDILDTYNDQVLCALRDTLEVLATCDQGEFEKNVRRYLLDKHNILRRLAIYLVQNHPDIFRGDISQELLNQTNWSDVSLHHEFFLLLAHGFPLLPDSEKKAVISLILNGPDIDELNRIADLIYKDQDFDREKWLTVQKNLWIRDRLWMIRGAIEGSDKDLLIKLVEEYHEPEHPLFLSWISEGFWVSDVSPFPEQDLVNLPPERLLEIIQSWKPPDEKFGPERISYTGLAKEVAKLVCSSPEKYESYLHKIAFARPEIALAIFSLWSNPEYKSVLVWPIIITLCQNLLDNPVVWGNEKPSSYDHESWRNVRMAVARLLDIGFSNREKSIPMDQVSAVQDLLLRLAEDSDPTLEDDRPPEGWFGHNDPGTVALNHVRPIAIHALIISVAFYYRNIAQGNTGEEIVRYLPQKLKNKFDQKLDAHKEPSRAVRSIFGELLPTLYWVDRNWTLQNLDKVFPIETDDESIWLFISAWDSYITNNYWEELFSVIRSKYEMAISYVTRGLVTESHLQQTTQLAFHLLFEYLFSEYDIRSPAGQESLLVKFLALANPELRSRLPWALWKILANNKREFSMFWDRAKKLWEWREKEAAIANHSPDFNSEISEFAWLLQVAPTNETISSLYLLLLGLLPHIKNIESHNTSWTSIEMFLARQVESEWIDAIKFYRQMCEQKVTLPNWVYFSDHAKKIIESSLAHPESRPDAMALIDFFARRWKDYTFRDLYIKYSR